MKHNPIKTAELATKRNLVLDAAETLFTKKGIEQTSMASIAKAVGYTRASLYNHFGSWDDICLQVHFRHMQIRAARLFEKADSGQPPLERLFNWGKDRYDYCCQFPMIVELQTYLDFRGLDEKKISPHVMQEYHELNMQLKRHHVALFEAGIADGSIRSDINIEVTISHFAYGLRAIINRALSPTYSMTPINSDEYVHLFLDLLIKGISK